MSASHCCVAADRNDPTTVSETRRRRLDGEKDPTYVDVEHPVEIFHVHRRDVTKQQDASVDNRNIQFPEMIHGLRNGCFDSSRIRAISLYCKACPPGSLNRRNRVGGSLGRRHVGHRYIGALFCQTSRCGCANASRAAKDNGNLSRKSAILVHWHLLLLTDRSINGCASAALGFPCLAGSKAVDSK